MSIQVGLVPQRAASPSIYPSGRWHPKTWVSCGSSRVRLSAGCPARPSRRSRSLAMDWNASWAKLATVELPGHFPNR
ncbi:MAG: hypothetical protein M3N34_02170 [Pseudomonadota bacterium]|nr:hypothetical protein [Pseudomonadota bacterium]